MIYTGANWEGKNSQDALGAALHNYTGVVFSMERIHTRAPGQQLLKQLQHVPEIDISATWCYDL